MTKKNTIISIVLKSIVIVAALVGTFLSYWAGRNSFMGVMYWIILIASFLVGMGFLYLFFVKLLQKKVK